MQIKKYFLGFCLLLFGVIVFAEDVKPLITDYHRTWVPCLKNDELRIAIRKYQKNGIDYYLVVNPSNFVTEAAPEKDFQLRKVLPDGTPGYFTWEEITNTPYGKALFKEYSLLPPTQRFVRLYKYFVNYGVIHAAHLVDGYFLTVDMLPSVQPSVRPYEKEFFLALVARSQNEGPIPVALGITGGWIQEHSEEFNNLLQWERDKKLQITWINHSYSQVYYHDLAEDSSLGKNFLLSMQTNVKSEILDTEKLLLENEELPSVFFRFPGLISNKKLNSTLREYGLIPIGSDAWLNKQQKPVPGSIILVFGNSNEHPGIEKVMPIITQTGNHLLPLSQLFL